MRGARRLLLGDIRRIARAVRRGLALAPSAASAPLPAPEAVAPPASAARTRKEEAAAAPAAPEPCEPAPPVPQAAPPVAPVSSPPAPSPAPPLRAVPLPARPRPVQPPTSWPKPPLTDEQKHDIEQCLREKSTLSGREIAAELSLPLSQVAEYVAQLRDRRA